MSACAIVVMVNLGVDLSKQRLPEQTGPLPMQSARHGLERHLQR